LLVWTGGALGVVSDEMAGKLGQAVGLIEAVGAVVAPFPREHLAVELRDAYDPVHNLEVRTERARELAIADQIGPRWVQLRAVVLGTPVASVTAAHNSRSAATPRHPPDVPLQVIASTSASASSRAASTTGPGSNWPAARPTSTTRIRPKWAETPGRPATIADVRGSSRVFDEGVSTPSVRFSVLISPHSSFMQAGRQVKLGSKSSSGTTCSPKRSRPSW
jgi:hypothetical protein